MFFTQQLDMTRRHTDAMAPLRAWTQRLLGMLSLLGLSACLVACGGGGGGAAPRFTWDATTSTLKDSTTGLYWKNLAQGSSLTTGQRLPTVDELLLLSDKTTLTDIPAEFRTNLLSNDLVFASDYDYTSAGLFDTSNSFFPEGRASVWAVSFLSDSISDDRGVLLKVSPSELPTAMQPVIVSGSASAFNRNRSTSNYVTTTKPGVIYDIQNDLSWKMCSEPVAVSGIACSGQPAQYSFSQLAAILATSSNDGWRLPTKYELEALLDRSRGFQAVPKSYLINTGFFDLGTTTDSVTSWWDNTPSEPLERSYWSSTKNTSGVNFVVSFDWGSVRLATTGSSYYVRLVRNGKY